MLLLGDVEELVAGRLNTIAGIRPVGETPLTLAITKEEGLRAFALLVGIGLLLLASTRAASAAACAA